MEASELREQVRQTALDAIWGQWGALGVPASLSWHGRAALDPEALVVFTLDIARREARVFDEVLDWLRRNGRLLSTQRLANLVHGDELGGRLVGAALTWAREHGGALRPPAPARRRPPPEGLFGTKGWKETDSAFLAFGFERPEALPSFKAEDPRLDDPVNLAIRLRHHFGVGVRAEVVRFLLTWPGPYAGVADITRPTGFAKRNVAASLAELTLAGVVSRQRDGNRDRISIDTGRWAAFLETTVDELPTFTDWPALFSALRGVHTWLSEDGVEDLSDYMRASEARRLVNELRPMLDRAGVRVVERGVADEYWTSFVQTVGNALAVLAPAPPPEATTDAL